MSIQKKIIHSQKRRALRVRSRLKRITSLPRVSVFRSANHIYAQLIDDVQQKTIASCSSLDKGILFEGGKKNIAHHVGLELAKRAKENGIMQVCFDRGSFLYHGRVQALAEGLRAGGLHV